MSKKPTTNEKLQFALTLTPAPQSCQIEISRHSWTPPHSFRYLIEFLLFLTISNPQNALKFSTVRLGSETSEQPMRENSLLWIDSRDYSHKNGILNWVVVFGNILII
jgi:hypothetical protein